MTRQDADATGESVPDGQRGYVVRDAGTPGHPGPVSGVYPYTLKALLEAMDDARFRSFGGPPQELVKTGGPAESVIRRYEGGREVPA